MMEREKGRQKRTKSPTQGARIIQFSNHFGRLREIKKRIMQRKLYELRLIKQQPFVLTSKLHEMKGVFVHINIGTIKCIEDHFHCCPTAY